MLGMLLQHHDGTFITIGTVTAQTVQPDGTALVRICDKWVPADECEGA
ncbi:hypothetical protein [Chelativorans xinjiangense]|nr:hypothetical protein [Chelativorans xinjiangense]